MTDQVAAPHRTKAPKPTRAEREARITEVFKLLIIGLARHDIVRYVADRTIWNLKERAIDYLIARATARFEAHAKVRRDQELGKAIARLNDLYSRTHRVQDFKTCLMAQRELNELLGLYAPKRLEHLGPEGSPQHFIAILPPVAPDHVTWSAQCKQERDELERQRLASSSSTSGGA